MEETSAVLLVVGSIVFGIGASIGVPSVFNTADREVRRELLDRHRTRWQLAQPLYALGPLVAGVAVGLLATAQDERAAAALLLAAGALLFVGACAWSYSCLLRGLRPVDFALGELPGRPFATYVWLTLGGLALLGAALLTAGYPGWLGWLVLGADVAFLVMYLAMHDIPPFVFYVLLTVVGVAVLVG